MTKRDMFEKAFTVNSVQRQYPSSRKHTRIILSTPSRQENTKSNTWTKEYIIYVLQCNAVATATRFCWERHCQSHIRNKPHLRKHSPRKYQTHASTPSGATVYAKRTGIRRAASSEEVWHQRRLEPCCRPHRFSEGLTIQRASSLV